MSHKVITPATAGGSGEPTVRSSSFVCANIHLCPYRQWPIFVCEFRVSKSLLRVFCINFLDMTEANSTQLIFCMRKHTLMPISTVANLRMRIQSQYVSFKGLLYRFLQCNSSQSSYEDKESSQQVSFKGLLY